LDLTVKALSCFIFIVAPCFSLFLSFSERRLYHLQLALHSEVKERDGD